MGAYAPGGLYQGHIDNSNIVNFYNSNLLDEVLSKNNQNNQSNQQQFIKKNQQIAGA